MLIDMTGRGRDREIVFDRIGQVLSPSWSPDGRSIAVSALAGGLTDLYVCDVASGRAATTHRRCVCRSAAGVVARRPHDRVRDRALLERSGGVAFGRPQLAVMDVETRAVRNLSVSASAAHLNPQWSPDDRDLYFVSDPDGTMNIYRLGLDALDVVPDHERRYRRQRHHADQSGVFDGGRRVGAGLHGLRTRPAATGRAGSAAGAGRRAMVDHDGDRTLCSRGRRAGRHRSLPGRSRYRPAGAVVDRDPHVSPATCRSKGSGSRT